MNTSHRKLVMHHILMERERQIEELGYQADHDDAHADGSLAMAAALYAAPEQLFIQRRLATADAVHFMDPWPWEKQHDKRRRFHGGGIIPAEHLPADVRRKQLVQAAALIVAEIERLDRLQAAPDFDRSLHRQNAAHRAPANEGTAAMRPCNTED